MSTAIKRTEGIVDTVSGIVEKLTTADDLEIPFMWEQYEVAHKMMEEAKPGLTKLHKVATDPDPDRRIYGPSTTEKILDLHKRFTAVEEEVSALHSSLAPKYSEWQANEKARAEQEAAAAAAKEAAEKAAAEEAARAAAAQAAAEAEAKRQAEEEARKKAEALMKKEEEEEARRRAEALKKKADEEAARLKAEQEADEFRRKRQEAELQAAVEASLPPPTATPGHGAVIHLKNGGTELMQVLKDAGSDRLVVVDWSAPWCGPCKFIEPHFEEMAREHPHVSFVHVNTEETPANRQLTASAQVSAYPTFHFYKQMKRVREFSGADKNRILTTIAELAHAPSPTKAAASPTATTATTTTTTTTPTPTAATTTTTASPTPVNAAPGAAGDHMAPGLANRFVLALGQLKAKTTMDKFVAAARAMSMYVSNLLSHPGEEKFTKIRVGNPNFQVKVAKLDHGLECMHVLGFVDEKIDGQDYLIMKQVHPELGQVSTQLQAVLPNAATSAATSTPPNPFAPTAGAGAAAGAAAAQAGGGMPGFPGMPAGMGAGMPGGFPGMPPMPGMPPGMDMQQMQQMAQDPNFQRVAQQLQNNPQLMQRLMAAMQPGPNGMPNVAAMQQVIMENPELASAMMSAGGALRGMPGMAGMPGMGGFPGAGAMPPATTPGTAPGTTPGAGAGAGGFMDEDAQLAEAIRLSLLEQEEENKRQSSGNNGDNNGDGDNNGSS